MRGGNERKKAGTTLCKTGESQRGISQMKRQQRDRQEDQTHSDTELPVNCSRRSLSAHAAQVNVNVNVPLKILVLRAIR